MSTHLWEAVDRKFQVSDISGAIQLLEELLTQENGDRFQGLLGKGFSNSPSRVLCEINKFIDECCKKFDPRAVYLEMNGFDINPDRWYFDSFAYAACGADPQDIDWLCDWQSPDWPQVTLTGLEAIQADFDWYHSNEVWRESSSKNVYDIAVLLVMCKFVRLIQSALESGARLKPVAVLATVHDFDILGRFEAQSAKSTASPDATGQ